MIQPPGLNIFFDLHIPRIGLHLGEPLCKFALFPVRKLFDLGSDLRYGGQAVRVHRGKDSCHLSKTTGWVIYNVEQTYLKVIR